MADKAPVVPAVSAPVKLVREPVVALVVVWLLAKAVLLATEGKPPVVLPPETSSNTVLLP